MARVEILEIVRPPLPTDQLRGASIDHPTVGERREHYAIVVAGWVLSREEVDAPEIRAVSEGRIVGRWPANRSRPDVAAAFAGLPIGPACGFMGVVQALDLPSCFELIVEMEHRGERLVLATIVGRRSALAAPDHERLRPVFLTTLGRTGSTLIMQLLGQHDRIVVQPPFPYEARVAAYWSAVFAQLSSPASYLQAVVSTDDRPFWWVGGAGVPAETYLDPSPAVDRLGGRALEAMATFVRRQVAAFYEASAVLQGKAGDAEAWFVEKQLPRPDRQCLEGELFPDGRAIYLVRDFRDMVASILAINRKRGYLSFGRAAEDDDDAYVVKLAVSVDELLQAFRAAGERGLLVRYEDAVREPHATVARMLAFLALERSDATIASMIRAAEETEPAAREQHRTTDDAFASIGRYRRDLGPRLAERCGTLFADALAACGYPV